MLRREIDLSEAAAGVKETVVVLAVLSSKIPDDLPRVVDARGRRRECTGYIDLSEGVRGSMSQMDCGKPTYGHCCSKDDRLVHATAPLSI